MKLHLTIILLALTGTTLAQGPLTPPPGANPSIGPVNALTGGGLPQATMKTLHQVEPRTAIAGGTSGVVIAQSGAYYLTGNIQVASGDGITINVSNVTLDLNGFSISSSAAPAAGNGIAVTSTTNLAISNGSIDGGFVAGVAPSNGALTPRNVRVANLTVSNCANWGVLLDIAKNTRVDGCLVDGAVGGIQATLVHDCSVSAGSISGRIVKGCSVTGATLTGIAADIAENCYAQATGTAIQAKCLVNSYGTGGGNNDVISAGVAQNVWGEGTGGLGDGVHAKVVSNSYGKRSRQYDGTNHASGIEALVVAHSHGEGMDGIESPTGVTTGSLGIGGTGIYGSTVVASQGLGEGLLDAPGIGVGIDGQFLSASFGKGSGPNTNQTTGVFGKIVIGSRGEGGGSPSAFGIDTVSGGFVVDSFGYGGDPAYPLHTISSAIKFHTN